MHLVELTAAGEQLFGELRKTATAFDRRLRTDLDAEDIDRLGTLLATLVANATAGAPAAASGR
jgi:DNA-binding MarR family transcriptional regulator